MENYQKILDLFNGLKPHLYPYTGFKSSSNLFDINLYYNGEFMFVFNILGKYHNPNISYESIIQFIDKFYKWYDLDNVKIDIYYRDGSKPETLSYYEMFSMVDKHYDTYHIRWFESHPKATQIREWSRNKDIETYRGLMRNKQTLWDRLKSKCVFFFFQII
jgi:hypothetical protein